MVSIITGSDGFLLAQETKADKKQNNDKIIYFVWQFERVDI